MTKIRQFLHRWFDLPLGRPSASPTKSGLRLTFEAECRCLHFHGAAAVNAFALVLLDGARLLLSMLDRLIQKSRVPFIYKPRGQFVDSKIRSEEAKWQASEDYTRSLKEY